MSTDRREVRFAFVLLVGLAALSPCGRAAADQAPAPDQVAGELQEVVVTAERRVENLQSVPISATVLNAADLAKRGITGIDALQQAAPSVAINTEGASTFINIRGVGLSQSSPVSSPGVAVYLNGVLIPHETLVSTAFFDLNSVEILRGPQGTLSGQNSTGGAIYFRSPAPRFNAISGYLHLTGGSYSRNRDVGALNVGLNDNVALRVAAVHDGTNSYTRNIGPSGKDPGNGTLDAARADLALRTANNRLRVNLRGEYFDYESDDIALKSRDDTVTADPFVIEQDAHTRLDRRGYRVSAEVNYDLSSVVRLRELTGYEEAHVAEQTDVDLSATASPVLAGGAGSVALTLAGYRTLTTELDLLSQGNGPLRWVVGGFFMNDDLPNAGYTDLADTVDFVSSTLTGFVATSHNTSRSIFGQTSWFATRHIQLIAGARYNWDKQIFARSVIFNQPFRPAYTGTPARSTSLTGKAGINYHFDDGTLLYATASKGYKAGGVNLLPGLPNFSPETNVVYEFGLKTEQLDRHLRVDADVFRSDYRNIQLQTVVPIPGFPPPPPPAIQNASAANSWGAELETLGRFGGLGFNLGVSYLDAKFSQSACITNPDVQGTSPGCPETLMLVPDGAALPFSPRWTLNAGIQYAIPLAAGRSVTPRVQWSHLARQYATPFPNPFSIVPARDLFDAMLTLQLSERYSVEGLVTNLTNETYIASQDTRDTGILYGAPREYELRLSATFGE